MGFKHRVTFLYLGQLFMKLQGGPHLWDLRMGVMNCEELMYSYVVTLFLKLRSASKGIAFYEHATRFLALRGENWLRVV
jgi:hypothetical protein